MLKGVMSQSAAQNWAQVAVSKQLRVQPLFCADSYLPKAIHAFHGPLFRRLGTTGSVSSWFRKRSRK
jgi:hypothetical protein